MRSAFVHTYPVSSLPFPSFSSSCARVPIPPFFAVFSRGFLIDLASMFRCPGLATAAVHLQSFPGDTRDRASSSGHRHYFVARPSARTRLISPLLPPTSSHSCWPSGMALFLAGFSQGVEDSVLYSACASCSFSASPASMFFCYRSSLAPPSHPLYCGAGRRIPGHAPLHLVERDLTELLF